MSNEQRTDGSDITRRQTAHTLLLLEDITRRSHAAFILADTPQWRGVDYEEFKAQHFPSYKSEVFAALTRATRNELARRIPEAKRFKDLILSLN